MYGEVGSHVLINLISLACDNNDIQMLNALRARENPQLYFRAHYLSGQHPDFNACYNERMIKHIAESDELVLNYFTDSFEIRWCKKLKYNKLQWLRLKNNENSTDIVNQLNFQTSKDNTLFGENRNTI